MPVLRTPTTLRRWGQLQEPKAGVSPVSLPSGTARALQGEWTDGEREDEEEALGLSVRGGAGPSEQGSPPWCRVPSRGHGLGESHHPAVS